MSNKECKQRYFKKVYENAKLVKCKCGCGEVVKNKDKYGRNKEYINGHNARKYEDSNQYKREWNHRNRATKRKYKKSYQHKRKAKLIRIKGGKCIICPIVYDGKNACIFQFHHRDPKKKIFSVNLNSMNNYKWSVVLKELEKCDLVCANCHFKIHGGEY